MAQAWLRKRVLFLETRLCATCGCTYRSRYPSMKWRQVCWHKLGAAGTAKPNEETEKARAAMYQRRAVFCSPFVPVMKHGAYALDIGAGYGAGATALKEIGYQVDAVEPDTTKADEIRDALHIYCCTAENFAATPPMKHYTLMMACHVIEHTEYPREILYQLTKHLAEGGILYAEIPLQENIVNWSDALYIAHLQNFTAKAFEQMAEQAGYRICLSASTSFEDDRMDMGYGMTPTGRNALLLTQFIFQRPSYGFVSSTLYRQGLPFDVPPGPIMYNVPHIEDFYYTLRFDRWNMFLEDGWIEFTPRVNQ